MSKVVDVEDIVRAWSWDMWDKLKTKEQAKLSRDHLDLDINWKRVKFSYGEPDFKNTAKPDSPKAKVLFKTFFSNNTEQEQEYSFKTERVTRSSCTVEIGEGVTKGIEGSVKLQTPCEVFEASAGFKREVTVEKFDGQTLEEELTWSVDSQIKVPSKHKTVAELVITEDEYDGSFNIKSKFEGKVLVTVTNIKDNNSFVKSLEGSMAEIFRREIENGLKGFRVERNTVCYQTSGTCHFHYGVEQHVKLNQFAIKNED